LLHGVCFGSMACARVLCGRIAAPLPPKAATNPIEVTCRCRGRSLVTITTTPCASQGGASTAAIYRCPIRCDSPYMAGIAAGVQGNCGSATSKGSDKPYRGDMQMPRKKLGNHHNYPGDASTAAIYRCPIRCDSPYMAGIAAGVQGQTQ
jgi:hypothetical protein